MDSAEIRNQMMKLWKDTFHDSDEYINTVFDHYFSEDLIEYEVVDGNIVAAMMAVPYSFVSKDNHDNYSVFNTECGLDNVSDGCKSDCSHSLCDDEKYIGFGVADALSEITIKGEGVTDDLCHDMCSSCDAVSDVCADPSCKYDGDTASDEQGIALLRGLYMCGLATKPEYRGEGIMSQLIERMNEKAGRLGYAFTFLIPASQGLRKYYSDRGYINSFFVNKLCYLSSHNFNKSFVAIVPKVSPNSSSESGGCADATFRLIRESNSNSSCGNCENVFVSIKGLLSIIDRLTNESVYNNFTEYSCFTSSNVRNKFVDGLCGALSGLEIKSVLTSSLTLLHSPKDYEAIIADCMDSFGDILVGVPLKKSTEAVLCKSDDLCKSDTTPSLLKLPSISENANSYLNNSLDAIRSLRVDDEDVSITSILRKYLSVVIDVEGGISTEDVCDIFISLLMFPPCISSAVFVYPDYEEKCINVKEILADNTEVYESLLAAVMSRFPEMELSVVLPFSRASKVDGKLPDPESYAMLRPVNVAQILKYLACIWHGAEFSALVAFSKKQYAAIMADLELMMSESGSYNLSLIGENGCNLFQCSNFKNDSTGKQIIEKWAGEAECGSSYVESEDPVNCVNVEVIIGDGYFTLLSHNTHTTIRVSFYNKFNSNSDDSLNLNKHNNCDNGMGAICLNDFISMLFSRVHGRGVVSDSLGLPSFNPSLSLMLD